MGSFLSNYWYVISSVGIGLCIFGCSNASIPETHTVVIEQMKYKPEEITVKMGDTILFINKDIVDHDVTQEDQSWASPILKMEDTWKFVPEKSDEYYCSIHLVMKGKIIVQ